ncbi:VOC family protein [Pontibacillus yanchengensis]|uniref:Glyoxalase-like domain-containing protein n=1 Tax=Pontibacillus yanchengensis Y32 TaxID=1385514 RepID=A0A0A2TNZ7_9BACI|nr:VOC family protein [Pontibacillus yanchengensis]KGP71065.1 hypothetical protein N782_21905 [Pontibacillus yanchengensis Y32]
MLAFDHLVVLSSSPEKAQHDFSSKHGVRGLKGGHHESWGTYNHLAFFDNQAYIEWIGIENHERAEASDNPLIKHVSYSNQQEIEGTIQFALRTNEMDEVIRYFDKEEIAYEGPFEGSRTKPNGTTLSWRMLFPSFDASKEVLPFLIEWDGPPNAPDDDSLINATPFSKIHVGVKDLEKATLQWQHIYQLESPTYKKDNSENPYTQWNLENGTLILSPNTTLKAEFGPFSL